MVRNRVIIQKELVTEESNCKIKESVKETLWEIERITDNKIGRSNKVTYLLIKGIGFD